MKQQYEERRNIYKGIIKKSKNIIFIGFGFDRDNLDMLGFPSNIAELSSFFKKKSIKWLNHEGSMMGLSEQFNHLMKDETVDKKERVIIIESKASNVYTAYQNDFKIALYENN